MGVLRFTGAKRCERVLTLLKVAREKPYLYRYTAEEMRMTITTTPATTPTTMAIVWSSESSAGGSSAEEEMSALSVKANHTVNRSFFSTLACLLGLYCVLMNVVSGVVSDPGPVCSTEPCCHAF